MYARIIATGSYLPERVVRNDDLTQFPTEAIPLVEQKTGVRERRHAAPDECTSDLGAKAAAACLTRAGFDPLSVDALILATSSPDRIQPATATRVQHLVGARRAFALDVNSVCAGSVYALHLADSLIRSGSCRSVLVVAAELYSRFLNPNDFATYPYFGDGAGAALLVASEKAGIVQTVLHSDGAGADVIEVPAGGSKKPLAAATTGEGYFRMRGREVYQFATSRAPEVIREVLVATGTAAADVRVYVPHQANINIIRELAAQIGVESGRFWVNLDRRGNTAAASVLIALDEALTAGAAGPGDLVLLVAFGGGLSWGASLVRL